MVIHTTISWLSLLFGAAHGLLLLFDSYFSYRIPDVLIPFTGPYRPLATGLGTVGFWIIFLVTPSFALRKRLFSHRAWKTLHYTSYAAFILVTVHGLAGGLGLLAVGIFADGRSGAGWNGVGASAYLGVPGQGVTGLLAAPGFQPDWPGQMQAQLVGLAALALLGFFAAWLFSAPPALLIRLLRTPTKGYAAEAIEASRSGALETEHASLAIDPGTEEPVVDPTAPPNPILPHEYTGEGAEQAA